jgi:hypothetical protein
MVAPPPWLAQQYRIEAAVADGRPFAPEDALAFSDALKKAAIAKPGARMRTVEDFMGWPSDWRFRRRLIEKQEAITILVSHGYVGRGGAKRVIDVARRGDPNARLAKAVRKLLADGPLSEDSLAKSLR